MRILYFTVLLLITISFSNCDNKETVECSTPDFLPNKYKFYLPYEQGSQILFENEQGLQDTSIVNIIEQNQVNYSQKDCFQPSETFKFEMLFKFNQTESCNISFSSNLHKEPPYMVVSSQDCLFQASFQSVDLGDIGVITSLDNFEFKGETYEDVLIIKIEDETIDVQELVLAKNIGFVYIKYNDKITIPL